jgi:3'(2'), 5'-bisphosphate nucleotidase
MQSRDRSLEVETALRAVARACHATLAVRRRVGGATAALAKEDKSPVTVADFAAQAVVAAALQHAFGDDPLVGEESARALAGAANASVRGEVASVVGQALGVPVSEEQALEWIDRGNATGGTERHWALDPVDGTKGFLRGGQYAIALALIERGEVVAAVLGCPAYEVAGATTTGILIAAQRGGGAFETPLHGAATATRRLLRRERVREVAALRMCESVESGHTDQGVAARVAAALGMSGEPLRMDSQAKYAAVARGDADVYLRLPTRKDYRERIWDHAAGALVLTEAGGVVTDVDGKPLDFSRGVALEGNRGVVASVAADHERVVAAVQRALA